MAISSGTGCPGTKVWGSTPALGTGSGCPLPSGSKTPSAGAAIWRSSASILLSADQRSLFLTTTLFLPAPAIAGESGGDFDSSLDKIGVTVDLELEPPLASARG